MDYNGGRRKIHAGPACFFITSLVTKKIASKTLLTSTFIHLLLNSFDLPSYSSKSRKRYALKLLGC